MPRNLRSHQHFHALEAAIKYVDMVQVGARNMQNFQLLQGGWSNPVIRYCLKRGYVLPPSTNGSMPPSTSWLREIPMLSSVSAASAPTRLPPGTPSDISAVPVIRSRSAICPLSWIPATPLESAPMLHPWQNAAIAAGADGIMVETHNNPACALSDGPQSLTLPQFDELAKMLDAYAKLEGREFS